MKALSTLAKAVGGIFLAAVIAFLVTRYVPESTPDGKGGSGSGNSEKEVTPSPPPQIHHVMVPVAPAWSEPIAIPAHHNICPSSSDPTVGSVRSRLYHNGEVVKEYVHQFGAKDGFEFDGIAYQSVSDKPFGLDYILTYRP